jgi:N-terminal acetyltransferase B complex non-catalytic subunit
MARLPGGEGDVLHHLTNPSGISVLRDAALAVRWAAGSLADQTGRDNRSGKSSLHRDVVAEAKGLEDLAGKVLGLVRARLGSLKEVLGLGGWLDRMEGWAFAPASASSGYKGEKEDEVSDLVRGVVGEADVEEWGGKVVESWREGVKGLCMVKME